MNYSFFPRATTGFEPLPPPAIFLSAFREEDEADITFVDLTREGPFEATPPMIIREDLFLSEDVIRISQGESLARIPGWTPTSDRQLRHH